MAQALAAKIQTLPEALRRSLTWDQGPAMRDWKQVKLAGGIDIYFADPHSPWQRGSDLSIHTEADLDAVATELNDRPRKRLESSNQTKPTDRCCCADRANPPFLLRKWIDSAWCCGGSADAVLADTFGSGVGRGGRGGSSGPRTPRLGAFVQRTGLRRRTPAATGGLRSSPPAGARMSEMGLCPKCHQRRGTCAMTACAA